MNYLGLLPVLCLFCGDNNFAQPVKPGISTVISHCMDNPPPPGCRPPERPPVSHIQQGSIVPKYGILLILYAPPGANGGHSASSVEYDTSTTLGSQLTNTDTFTSEIGVSATFGADTMGSGVSVTAAVTASGGGGTSNALDVKVTTGLGFVNDGPSADGINHDYDRIVLWFNPIVPTTKTWQTVGNTVVQGTDHYAWSLGTTTNGINSLPVRALWLKDPSTMPSDVQRALTLYGITPAEYPNILSADLPATGASLRSYPQRYASTGFILPYTPPTTPTDAPDPPTSMPVSGSNTYTTGGNTSLAGSFSLTVEAKASFIASSDLKVSDKFSWEHKSSLNTSEGYSSSASVKVGGPAAGYNGPVQIEVFLDTIFHTFAFDTYTPSGSALASGTIVNSQQKPLYHAPVSLVVGGVRRVIFTDRFGNYSFYGLPAGQSGTISAEGIEKAVVLGQSSALHADLVLH